MNLRRWKLKKFLILSIIAVSMLLPLNAFAQSSSQSENCPPGTKPEVRGASIECIQVSNVKRTCPVGTYQGVDNQGNFACRDIDTNQIVDPNTGLMYDSQTGEMILDNDQSTYIGIGIIIVIIIIGVIAAVARKKTPYKDLPRRGFSESIKEQVLRQQNHRCAECNRVLDVVDFDHIDADKTNNDISNCQALCPNCHAKKSRNERSKYNQED